MIKGIIFDFDGVVVLSEEPRFKMLQSLAEKRGISIKDEEFKEMVGVNTINFLNNIISPENKHYIPEIIKDYEEIYKAHIEDYVKPIDSTINYIKNYNGPLVFGLATVASYSVVDKITKNLDIFYKFKSIICKENLEHRKPDPEIYFKSAQELNLETDQCLAIEDSAVGAKSALKAGVNCIVLLNSVNEKSDFEGLSVKGFIKDIVEVDQFLK